MRGRVEAIYIAPAAGAPMELVDEAEALEGFGLGGDRYAAVMGSWSNGTPGKRQVTFINAEFFAGSGFEYSDSRRNIVVKGIELMSLIGRDFGCGTACFHGVKYCKPCDRPSMLVKSERSFREDFFDRGGLVADVIQYGVIRTGHPIFQI